ncbi:MAG: hypothetical protein U0527_17935 [Candidatus Eisenbacteria bacterium]
MGTVRIAGYFNRVTPWSQPGVDCGSCSRIKLCASAKETEALPNFD